MDMRGISHTRAWGVGSEGKNSRGWEARGGIALGEIPNVDDEVMDAANNGTCISM